jgi:hypothetical protein
MSPVTPSIVVRVKAVVVGLVLAGCAPQHGELHVIQGTVPLASLPASLRWDCNVEAEHYHNWTHDISAASGHITGTAYFRAIRSPTEWFPRASATIRGEGKGDFAGVDFTRYPRPADSTAPHIIHGKPDGSADELWYHKQRAPLGAPLQFELRWTSDQLEVRFPPDAEWSTVPLSFKPTRFHLGCASGEVIFHDLTITSPAP